MGISTGRRRRYVSRSTRTRSWLPLEDSTEYQTVAGLLIHTLEAIPAAGTTVDAQGHRWTIIETEGPKITKVRVHPGGGR